MRAFTRKALAAVLLSLAAGCGGENVEIPQTPAPMPRAGDLDISTESSLAKPPPKN